ncbi:CCC motif membrane protein [Nonlabens xiamenensis]|uniref:CCC motif membrane protein n=1 Tax=Nonlabens xiamenensis TaxID=2341043 RepID=UPI000F60B4FB|nr:CCC motif membrane protein [Nonlabens xiamenensis]
MQKLNTTLVYILSVVGFLCCCIGIGTIAAIIAVVIASRELKKYNQAPDDYVNGQAMKTARVVAIVSLVLSLIGLAIFIWIRLNPCLFFEWYIGLLENNPNMPAESMDQIYQAAEKAGCR